MFGKQYSAEPILFFFALELDCSTIGPCFGHGFQLQILHSFQDSSVEKPVVSTITLPVPRHKQVIDLKLEFLCGFEVRIWLLNHIFPGTLIT